MAAARAGRFGRLLVDRLDRLSRRAHDLARIVDVLGDAEVAVRCSGHPSGIIAVTDDTRAVIRLLGTATIDDTPPDHTAPARSAEITRSVVVGGEGRCLHTRVDRWSAPAVLARRPDRTA